MSLISSSKNFGKLSELLYVHCTSEVATAVRISLQILKKTLDHHVIIKYNIIISAVATYKEN